MKLLTLAVPCFISEAYMENCIRSLLAGGEDVVIIIVDDGSKDNTADVLKPYGAALRLIRKESGGAGLVKFNAKVTVDGKVKAKGILAFTSMNKEDIYNQ